MLIKDACDPAHRFVVEGPRGTSTGMLSRQMEDMEVQAWGLRCEIKVPMVLWVRTELEVHLLHMVVAEEVIRREEATLLEEEEDILHEEVTRVLPQACVVHLLQDGMEVFQEAWAR